MGKIWKAKYIAPAIHAALFMAMLALWGDAGNILFIADLPFSAVAVGVMFTSAKSGVAIAMWGIGCTFWWFLLGCSIDALIGFFARKRRKQGVSVQYQD